MIDTKQIIENAGYQASPELESALSVEIQRVASNPVLIDRVFKRLFRSKGQRSKKTS